MSDSVLFIVGMLVNLALAIEAVLAIRAGRLSHPRLFVFGVLASVALVLCLKASASYPLAERTANGYAWEHSLYQWSQISHAGEAP